MSMEKIIDKTIAFVKEQLRDAEGGHDWFHVERVYRNALLIAREQDCDALVVSLGALLHDVADSKFHGGDEAIGPRMAREFMEREGLPADIVEHVVRIIENISFKGGHTGDFSSVELHVVRDADRLDAIGAVGIARTFNYGGFKNRALYDPSIPPQVGMSKEAYKNSTSPTINHFHEKLLLLKDLMHTDAGRRIAEQRHRYMEGFLEQFYGEVEGER